MTYTFSGLHRPGAAMSVPRTIGFETEEPQTKVEADSKSDVVSSNESVLVQPEPPQPKTFTLTES